MIKYNPSLPLFSIHVPKAGGTSFQKVLQTWFNRVPFPNLQNRPKLRRVLRKYDLDFVIQRFLGCGLYYHYKDHVNNLDPRVVSLGKKYIVFNRNLPECVHGNFEPYGDDKTLLEYYPDARQFVTVLRDPLELQTSLYFYHKRLLKDGGTLYWRGKAYNNIPFKNLDDWIMNRPLKLLDLFPWSLTPDNYENIFSKFFVHICVVENYQKSVDILADKLGFPKTSILLSNESPRTTENLSKEAIEMFKQKHQLEYQIYRFALDLNNS